MIESPISGHKYPSSFAIVSGKGGSGKTMIAATMARIFDVNKKTVLLVDADYGTAGLTYYLGLNIVSNTSVGLTNLEKDPSPAVSKYVQPMKGFMSARFIGVGEHKRRSHGSRDLKKFFADFVEATTDAVDVTLIDCRGGIDEDSLAVCNAVEGIIIVVETDTTSFQATQHLVEVLTDNGLSSKISGFIINKVFDDPSVIANHGTASFRAQYLNSIPFDVEATKSFLLGDLPSIKGMFATQVWHAVSKLMPEIIRPSLSPPMSLRDYRNLSLRDNNSIMGGVFLAFLSLVCGAMLFSDRIFGVPLPEIARDQLLTFLIALAVGAGLEPTRRVFGKVIAIYVRILTKTRSGNR